MEEIKWKYEKRKIEDLIENKINPRRLSKQKAEKLKESLEKFGICQPIVIQPNGKIIGGHQRLRILTSLGANEVDVSIPSRQLTEIEAAELTIGLNKISGEFDFDMLANQWEPSLLCEAGFTEEELKTEIIPKEQPKKFTITLKFENEDDLRHLEKELNPMMDIMPSASIKVRIK
jgi:ParB-like chromosome segregation protein Spo0J